MKDILKKIVSKFYGLEKKEKEPEIKNEILEITKSPNKKKRNLPNSSTKSDLCKIFYFFIFLFFYFLFYFIFQSCKKTK